MQMTEEEICRSYREAKDPNKQLWILADLNCIEYAKVLEILKLHNEPLKKRPYTRKAKQVEPKKISQEEVKVSQGLAKNEVKAELPPAIREILLQRLNELEIEKAALDAHISEISDFLRGGAV